MSGFNEILEAEAKDIQERLPKQRAIVKTKAKQINRRGYDLSNIEFDVTVKCI